MHRPNRWRESRILSRASTADLTQEESRGNNRVVYMDKHSSLYIQDGLNNKQPQDKPK